MARDLLTSVSADEDVALLQRHPGSIAAAIAWTRRLAAGQHRAGRTHGGVGNGRVPATILDGPDAAGRAVMRRLMAAGDRPPAGLRSRRAMLGGSGHPDGRRVDDAPDIARSVTVRDPDATLGRARALRASVPGAGRIATLDGMAGNLEPIVVDALRPVAAVHLPLSP